MYPRAFDYAAPTSVDEAIALLGSNDHAKVLAGGQSLIPLMKLRLVSPALVVDISRIPGLGTIDRDGDDLVIGPLVTHQQLATDTQVRSHAAALADAAAVVGDPQVRNRGTLGGSLCHGDSVADEPAAAIALGARFVLAGPESTREVAAPDFFVDTLTTAAAHNEVLVEVRVPIVAGRRSVYRKIGRRGPDRDYPVAGIGGVRDGDESIRLALTGASTRPQFLPAASDLAPDPGAGETAAGEVSIIGDIYGSADYKRHLVSVQVARVLAVLSGG